LWTTAIRSGVERARDYAVQNQITSIPSGSGFDKTPIGASLAAAR
jgi:hypothetical protein